MTDLPVLYDHLAADTATAAAALPAGTVADRFHALMSARCDQLLPYRQEMIALFTEALHPDSSRSLLGADGAGARERMKAAFAGLVNGAADAPKGSTGAGQSAELAAFLYGIHLLLILFWLYDRTPGGSATREMLSITRGGIGLLRPALALPPIARMMTRLAGALDAVLGGRGL